MVAAGVQAVAEGARVGCQGCAVLYTPPPFLVESTWNPRIPRSFRGMDIESSVYV